MISDTLPPEIPLTPEEENDPLLEPLPPPAEVVMVGDDCWELITNKEVFRFENMGELFLWLQKHGGEVKRAELYHRFRGEHI